MGACFFAIFCFCISIVLHLEDIHNGTFVRLQHQSKKPKKRAYLPIYKDTTLFANFSKRIFSLAARALNLLGFSKSYRQTSQSF